MSNIFLVLCCIKILFDLICIVNLNIRNFRLDDKLELKIPVHKRFGEWKLKSLNPVRKGCHVKVVGQSTMGFFHTSIAPRNFPGAFKVSFF